MGSPYYILLLFISTGEAEAILARAQATAKGIVLVSDALKETGGVEVSFSLELQVFECC